MVFPKLSVKAVTFDHWRTLQYARPDKFEQIPHLIHGHLSRQSVKAPKLAFLKAWTKTMNRYEELRRQEGLSYTAEKVLQTSLKKIGHSPPRRSLDNALDQAFTDFSNLETPSTYLGARPLLEYLNRKYRLALITNVFRETMTLIPMQQGRLTEFFDVITISCQHPYAKPDKRIFLHTLRKLGVRPHEAVHVGDTTEDDVKGARNAGMKVIHIARHERGSPIADLVVTELLRVKELL